MTRNLQRRLREHSEGRSTYTASYCPIYLCSFITVQKYNHAKELEAYFKTGSGIAFMRKRILTNGALA